jgi:uncharacterized LabA/DUF88 family protein
MDILVDYNNVTHQDRTRGPTFVIDKILNKLGFHHLKGNSRLLFRLYDGWYDNRTPTRLAQQVSRELLSNVPSTRTLTDGTAKTTLVVNAEPAYSLKIDPGTHLWHTFRTRAYPGGLACQHPASAGCTKAPCQLLDMYSFFSHQLCPSPGCVLRPHHFITKGEQKLVDTMLAADLFFQQVLRLPRAVIVSSDDDIWPAIKTVVDLGMHVIHIHTLPGHSTPTFYARGPMPLYTQLNL